MQQSDNLVKKIHKVIKGSIQLNPFSEGGRKGSGNIPGYASLLSVMILSITVVTLIFVGSIISIDNNKFNQVANDSILAGRTAYSCTETALNKLKTDLNYPGAESFTLDGVTCSILTISGTGNTNRVIKVSAVTSTNVVKKIQVDIQTVNPSYIFTSWQEVADFY